MWFEETFAMEDLIRQAGDCPRLSSGLKERVIADSVSARRQVRRRLHFDHVFAISSLCLWLGLVVWQHAAFFASLSPQSAIQQQIAVTSRLTDNPYLDSAVEDNAGVVSDGSQREWFEVERLMQTKSWRLNLLQRVFGS